MGIAVKNKGNGKGKRIVVVCGIRFGAGMNVGVQLSSGEMLWFNSISLRECPPNIL